MAGAAPGKRIWRLLWRAAAVLAISAGFVIPVLAVSGALSGPADGLPSDSPTSAASLETGAAVAASASSEGSITAVVTVAGSPDSDADGVPDGTDNCPTVPNGPNEATVTGVGNQTNTDADLAAAGARSASTPWATPATTMMTTTPLGSPRTPVLPPRSAPRGRLPSGRTA